MSSFDIKFDSTMLNTVLNKSLNETKKTKYEPDSSRTPVAWLPAGAHTIRAFLDPTGELIREFVYHSYGKKKFLCPNSFFAGKPNGIPCKFCDVHEQLGGDYRLPTARKLSNMLYAQIIDTDVRESKYFEKNKTYALISNNRRFRESFLSWVQALTTKGAQDFVLQYLNPTCSSQPTEVNVTTGPQGRVNIGVMPGSQVGPIELGEWYKPLTDVYISNEFDEESYNEALKVLKEDYLDDKGNLRDEFIKEAEETRARVEAERAEREAAAAAKAAAEESPSKAPTAASVAASKSNVPSFVSDDKKECWSHNNPTDPKCITCEYQEACSVVTVK